MSSLHPSHPITIDWPAVSLYSLANHIYRLGFWIMYLYYQFFFPSLSVPFSIIIFYFIIESMERILVYKSNLKHFIQTKLPLFHNNLPHTLSLSAWPSPHLIFLYSVFLPSFSRLILLVCGFSVSPPFFLLSLSLSLFLSFRSFLPSLSRSLSRPPFPYLIRQLKQPSCRRREQTEEPLCSPSLPLRRGKLMQTRQ